MSTLQHRANDLVERQLSNWPLAIDNYAALDKAFLRELPVGEGSVILQYNPERRRSATAAVDARSLAARPCFLCRAHQPVEQETVEWSDYKIQLNPYPIFPLHLTVSTTNHVPQSLADPHRVTHMLELAHELPDSVVFYNGPQCGASAPMHFHFQVGLRAMLPLCEVVMDTTSHPDDNRIEGDDEGYIAYSQQWGRFMFVICASQAVQAELYFARLQVAMMLTGGVTCEPMQNVLCWHDGDNYYLVVVPRRQHRPSNYGDGDGQWLLSPASTEMAGLWVIASHDDYERLTAADVQAIYDELCVDAPTAVKMIDNYFKVLNHDNE